jgi:ubiquinone biosynthesis protein UbiJ
MSEPPNLEALARRYLDLWQDQATALAGDAELARQIAQWLSMMQAGMVHGFQSPNTANPAPETSTGAASAAAASGGGQPGMDELARRLAALEKRLDRLEAGAQAGRPKSRKRTR